MCEDGRFIKKLFRLASMASTLAVLAAAPGAAQTAEIRVGIIGTDTSHVTAFTKVLNDKSDPNHVPGARVVAAFKGGYRSCVLSVSRCW